MDDGIIHKYYERLNSTSDPGKLLTSFYLELYNLPSSQFGMFAVEINRLIRLYGSSTVFYAMLDTLDMVDVNQEGVAKLLSYFCKKRLFTKENTIVPLDDFINKTQKKIDETKNRKRKLTIRSPFDE